MTLGARLPDVAPGVEVAEFTDELVVLVSTERRAVHLEAGPALVFDSCRHGHTTEQLLGELAAATGTDVATAGDWLAAQIEELARLGVLRPSED